MFIVPYIQTKALLNLKYLKKTFIKIIDLKMHGSNVTIKMKIVGSISSIE